MTTSHTSIRAADAASSNEVRVSPGGPAAKVHPLSAASEVDGLPNMQDGVFLPGALDLGRWDEDDIDLREIVERLEHHRNAINSGLTTQMFNVEGLKAHVEEGFKSMHRIASVLLAIARRSESSEESVEAVVAALQGLLNARLTELNVTIESS